MGLRLYQPPVESDIQSKPTAEQTSARARSLIRRARVNRTGADALRERRRRILAGAADPTGSSSTTPGSEADRRIALSDLRSQAALTHDRIIAMFGERWAHLHAGANPSPLRDDDNDPSPVLTMAVEPEFLGRLGPPRGHILRNSRMPSPNTAQPHRYSRRAGEPALRDDHFDLSAPRWIERPDRRAPRNSNNDPPFAVEVSFLDGLGDRNRSLSPDGDAAWDTLLTTLTPDPQPPSVGSSFASTAAASSRRSRHPAGASSSRTSFTAPDLATTAAEESPFEHPCESGCDNSDTEGEGEDMDEADRTTVFGGFSLRGGRRNNHHGTQSGDDPLELLGGVGGMQRIVRNLAAREDIPDEWWAEAGLSRTDLSREGSSSS